jgi:Uma2 family endonuclease
MKLNSEPSQLAASRLCPGEPAWEVAHVFPLQGQWSENDYLALEEMIGNQMIELDNGFLDVLSLPDLHHQDIVAFLLIRLDEFVEGHYDGEVIQAPLPVKFGKKQYREPDITYFERHHIKDERRPPEGAALVMEVVGPGEEARERDCEIKPRVYAKAKIPEYWIVDPEMKTITVLTLSGKSYKAHGVYKPGDQAASKLLKGFKVAVSDVFAAGGPAPSRSRL